MREETNQGASASVAPPSKAPIDRNASADPAARPVMRANGEEKSFTEAMMAALIF